VPSIEIIVIAAVALLIGILIGTILHRTLSPQASKSRAVETRLQETEQKLTDYQQEVTEHFADTAKLVNNLTQSYKEVHEHLATNALKQDWAPKVPNQEGTLREDYRLNEDDVPQPEKTP